MDFGNTEECMLSIRGKTDLPVNTITVRIRNGEGKETTDAVDVTLSGGTDQSFRVHTPGGDCTVTFIFLPGSSFDFDSFRFSR